jgi:hypothetical protein
MMRPSQTLRSSATAVVKALEGHFASVTVARQALNVKEMSALLALAPKAWITKSSSAAGRVSAAAIVAATSFLPSTSREVVYDSHIAPAGQLHSPTCPFHHEHVPLHALYKNEVFTKSPCEACLAKRLNFLASDDLSADLSRRSIRLPSRGGGATSEVPSPVVDTAIQSSFGSLEAFKEQLQMFLSNRRGSGYTWLVWKSGVGASEGKMMIVNMPRNVSPSTIGMWPVAAFDVTDGVVGAVHMEMEKFAEAQVVEHPSWSRAARNPDAAVTRRTVSADAASAVPQDLPNVVTSVVAFYADNIDWKTVETQIEAARSYYASEQRAQKRKDVRQELEAEATKKALRLMDAADAESEATATQTPAATKSNNPQPQQKSSENKSASVSAAQSSSHAAPAAAPPVQDPTLTMSEDGVQTFTYRDGRKTVVDPNTQTTVFYTAEHTATSYGDGTTHFLFANGAEVWTDKAGQSYAKDPRQE